MIDDESSDDSWSYMESIRENEDFSVRIFRQLDINKILGIGIGNATEYLMVLTGMNIPLDNSYIPLLLEMGIIGGSVWILVLVGFFFYSMYMSNGKYSIPFLIGILAYSIFEHEFSMDIYSLHWLVYFLSCISNKNGIF